MSAPWQGAELGDGTPRHLGRVVALQILYAMDLAGQLRVPQLARPAAQASMGRYFDAFGAPDLAARQLAQTWVSGVADGIDAIDRAIEHASNRWRLARMAVVDRNVLRLAAFELMCRPEVPRAVCINEAVELARAFGSERSAAFVNGVLDHAALSTPLAS